MCVCFNPCSIISVPDLQAKPSSWHLVCLQGGSRDSAWEKAVSCRAPCLGLTNIYARTGRTAAITVPKIHIKAPCRAVKVLSGTEDTCTRVTSETHSVFITSTLMRTHYNAQNATSDAIGPDIGWHRRGARRSQRAVAAPRMDKIWHHDCQDLDDVGLCAETTTCRHSEARLKTSSYRCRSSLA